MADCSATPFEALASYCHRLGLHGSLLTAEHLRLHPQWPTEPALDLVAGTATAWTDGSTTVRWDGCRLAAEGEALPHPAAALVLAYHIESLRRTGHPPTAPASTADLALALLDFGTVFPECFAQVVDVVSFFLEKNRKKTPTSPLTDGEALAALEPELARRGAPADVAALIGWLVWAGLFRRSRADQLDVLDRLEANRRAQAFPPSVAAWFDAALLLAQRLAPGQAIPLQSTHPTDWHERGQPLGLDFLDEPDASVCLVDARHSPDPPSALLQSKGVLIALLPRRWWTGSGFHRWRQQLARRFTLQLALEDPSADFRLCVLRPRTGDEAPPPLLVRFHRPLLALLPAEGATGHRRLDRLAALMETACQPPAEASARFAVEEAKVQEEVRPSLRVRQLHGPTDPTTWALAQSLPSWWLALLACGAWRPAAGEIDFRTRNVRGWAVAWAIGPHWPHQHDLHRAEVAPREVAGWLVARSNRWQPWIESGLFWRLCRLAECEGLPWSRIVRLPEATDWPAALTNLRGAALDAALIETLAGEAAAQVLARLADEEATSPERSDPAFDAFARASRHLLPPRPLARTLYRPRHRSDPPDYESLALMRWPRPQGALIGETFLGQYSWRDEAGRELWRGTSWAQAVWIGVQQTGDGELTCPRETERAAELVESYRKLRELTRRALRRAAFARGANVLLVDEWADQLLEAYLGPQLVPPGLWSGE